VSQANGTPGQATADRFAAARAVADAVLYEGYVLYPYRASSAKNQLRWQFGVLTPPAFSEQDRSERSAIRTECLLEPGRAPSLRVRIRCLQVQHRTVEVAETGPTGRFSPVDRLEVDGQVYVEWDEAVDRVLDLPALPLPYPEPPGYEEAFELGGGSEMEIIRRASGVVAGRLVRIRQPIKGLARVQVSWPDQDRRWAKIAVTVENATCWDGTATHRQAVMGHSLIAVHAILAVDDGMFVSLLDPPPAAARVAGDCHNEGIFPVLIGNGDVVLSSPIILYDQPHVAAESPGDLYDATEIDEILALRVLTLTDEEKSEARGTDARAAAIIDRCDGLPPEVWTRLHGAVRAVDPPPAGEPPSGPWWDPTVDASVDPWTDSVLVGGVEVRKGTAVRLQPSHRADAQDLFLQGLSATVAGVFHDVDGSQHVAVTIDGDLVDDTVWPGRYLYFHPDEVVPLAQPDRSR
jgi:hypothetical protein